MPDIAPHPQMTHPATQHPTRVFMVGCPRSGTTLVQSVLAAHPAVITFKESHFFDKAFRPAWSGAYRLHRVNLRSNFINFLDENGLGDDAQREAWVAELEALSSVDAAATWLIRFLDGQAKLAGRTLWLEKTPDHVWRIPLLSRVAPDARFIHIIRDPLPTVASLRKASSSWGSPRSWLHCLLHWRVSLGYSLRYSHSPQHYFVFYNDFVSSPQEETRRLLGWLDLPVANDLLDRRRSESGAIIGTQESWKQNTLGSIAPRSSEEPVKAPWYIHMYAKWARDYQRLYERVRRTQGIFT